MTWKNKTKLVVFMIPLLVVAILIYDVVAIHYGGTEASISSRIIIASYSMPFMPFMVGLFIGIIGSHLFWRMRPNKDTINSGIDKI